jgi:hypothetical protein
MNPLNLIPPQDKILAGCIAAAVVLAGAFSAGWVANGWRLGEQIAKIRREQAESVAAANEAARLKERALNKQLEEARNDAEKRETALRADADSARKSVVSLRDQLAANKRAMSDASAAAVRQYADAVANVFLDCTDKYRELAEEADRISSERQTLIDAWPK